jgi:DNA polymerase
MGAKTAFRTWTENYGMSVTLPEVELAVGTYRERFHKVKALWGLLDRAAKGAVRAPGQWFTARRIRFIAQTISGIPYLVMKLPSGRALVYPYPEIKHVFKESFGDFVDDLSFWGPIPGKSFYGRISTWGGTALENASQAIAADVMAYGLVRATTEGFEPEMLVHDQMLARDPNRRGDELLKQCMIQMPPWADGLPLAVKGGLEEYYS